MRRGGIGVAVIAVVIAAVGGFQAGRVAAPVGSEPGPTAGVVAPARGVKTRGVGPADCPDPDAVIAPLRAELELQRSLTAQCLHRYEGEPADWPADTPAALGEVAFTANVKAALAACAPEAKLVNIDCSEPPCAAFITGPFDTFGQVSNCPPWAEAYGSGAAMSQATSRCPGSEGQLALMLSPSWHDPEAYGGSDNMAKRQTLRFNSAICDD